MLALPLPMMTFVLSAIACALVWRQDIGNRFARRCFISVFAVITIGTLMTGLRFGYGLEQFIVIQRSLPLFVGPLLFLGFMSFAHPAQSMPRLATVHLIGASAAALLPQIIPHLRVGFDLVIGLSYGLYLAALLLLWRKGIDGLAYAPLNLARGLRQWMLAAAIMLGVTLVFDTSIAINFALKRSGDAITLISYGSVVLMVASIVAIIAFSRRTERQPGVENTKATEQSNSVELERSARTLLMETQLYVRAIG